MVNRHLLLFLWAGLFCVGTAHSQQNVVKRTRPLNVKKASKVVEKEFRYTPGSFDIRSGSDISGMRLKGLYEYEMEAMGDVALAGAGMTVSPSSIYKPYRIVTFIYRDMSGQWKVICKQKYKRCSRRRL